MKLLYFIGFRGAGKSTLGKSLASRWDCSFLDLDEVFKQRYGSIESFVEREGLDIFRQKEEAILRETARLTGHWIIATGGGVLDWQGSYDFLQKSASPKIYLDVDPMELWERLLLEPERRKVLHLHTFDDMLRLWEGRRPKFHKIATFSLVNRDITHALNELDSWRDRLWQGAP